METPWDGGERPEVCSGSLGHMTKMAITPIYGKNPFKISETKGPMTLVCRGSLPRGYIHVYKHEKICIKWDFGDGFETCNGQND